MMLVVGCETMAFGVWDSMTLEHFRFVNGADGSNSRDSLGLGFEGTPLIQGCLPF